MNDHFNELRPCEHELLALLMEECAETIHVIGKILRHGYHSTHPDDPNGPDNRDLLVTELGHIEAAKELLFKAGDLPKGEIGKSKRKKLRTVHLYLHHQGE